MSRPAKKEYPLSMRLPGADISLIDRAATLRGRSRTEFVRDAAVRAAEEVVLESLPIRMTARGFAAFTAALAAPASPVRELVELLKRRAPWEIGDTKKKA
ncbi:MAG: type II toxin-antitoxin system TacA family antitoxin [Myxococcaceae bacterium]